MGGHEDLSKWALGVGSENSDTRGEGRGGEGRREGQGFLMGREWNGGERTLEKSRTKLACEL